MPKLAVAVVGLALLYWSPYVQSSSSHLDELRSQYPYGLLGEDYGILTLQDLAINTCNAEVEKFSPGSNLAYPYWQCFAQDKTQARCEGMDYDPLTRTQKVYFEIRAENRLGAQTYLARGPMDELDCKRWIRAWRKRTSGEAHICISGSFAADSRLMDDEAGFSWVFDKFKTRKGCESYFSGGCRLENQENGNCILPKS